VGSSTTGGVTTGTPSNTATPPVQNTAEGSEPTLPPGGTSAGPEVTPPAATDETETPDETDIPTESSAQPEGSSEPDGPATDLEPFSFFVTSLAALQDLSGSPDGFGGDLRYGEADGLTGADKLCSEIAERAMVGASAKQWRAFLSTTSGGPDDGPVHAKDRIGEGPWYDRLGRVMALDLESLLHERPEGADPEIAEDFPNEDGVPNHAPDGEQVDNHDTLTGTNELGELYTAGGDAMASTCNNWTSAEPSGSPRVGHPWPTGAGGGGFGGGMAGGFAPPAPEDGEDVAPPGGGGGFGGGAFSLADWMSALDEAGCAPGVDLEEKGGPIASNPTVGSGGGYGAFYCFALTP
jgi:hypothetical protein